MHLCEGEPSEDPAMKVELLEPGKVNAKSGGIFIGSAGEGDYLLFPHVDSCIALIVYGENCLVGGHLGAQMPGAKETNYPKAGRYVWQKVAGIHANLNGKGSDCQVVTIGHPNWYIKEVVSDIWAALKPNGQLALKTTEKQPKGVDIMASRDKIIVKKCPNWGQTWEYTPPGEWEYVGPEDIK
jgi:hypothetical protein